MYLIGLNAALAHVWQALFFAANVSYFVVLDKVGHGYEVTKKSFLNQFVLRARLLPRIQVRFVFPGLTSCINHDSVAMDFGRALFGPIGHFCFLLHAQQTDLIQAAPCLLLWSPFHVLVP